MMTPPSCLKGLCVLALFFSCATAIAVMSVDLGGEFMKIAIVKPGVPMETVLNKESSRKTLTMVAFRDGERQFANMAQNTAVKFPPKAFFHLGQIIGRSFDDPQVALYKERFPFYNLVKDEERGTVLFKVDDETSYSVEELLGMILEKAREYAQDFAEQDVKDCVITVPAFYNQAERRAVKAAAEMVGLNVLQLMSDNAAVALNYGVFRRKDFNTTHKYFMFYDMGASSTTATVVGYNVVKTKEGDRVETNPQVTIKGVGFDRTLGGLEFTMRLRAHLAKTFNAQKKTKTQVETNYRSMAKLLKEAERVKKVLSANNDHKAQVEGLLEEKDFKAIVSRKELEEMCSDLYTRVLKPVDDALKVSEITLPEISEVILMGGGTRIPKVQELLMEYIGRSELGKSINTDEAAALGGVYQAAYLGKGFKVKKFGVREGNIYPINVEFEKQKSEEEEKVKVIKRTLFGRMNPYPQKKVMTFNKHTKDFNFDVTYSSLDFLSEVEKKSFSNPLISRYSLKGVGDALTKNKDLAESKGIKAHFRMDESGILTLDKVESVFEKNSSSEEEAEKSTWSKLGSAIGGLFGSSNKEEDNKVEDSPDTPEDDQAESDAEGTKEEKEKVKEENTEKKEKADEKDKEGPKNKDSEKKEEKKEETEKKDNKTEKAEEKKPAAPKVLNIKEEIKAEGELLDLKDMSKKQFEAAKEKLKALSETDRAKFELEKAQNELESFIFDMQDKLSLESGPHVDCSSPQEKETWKTQLSAASDWLYEQENAKKDEYNAKLKELKVSMEAMFRRVYELNERPRAVEALRSALNQSDVFLKWVKNMTDSDDPIYTPIEINTLDRLIKDTKKWKEEHTASQAKLPLYENPAILVDDVFQKVKELDREMRYMVNKAKNWKPKAKPKEEKKEGNGTETKTDKSKEDAPTKDEGDTSTKEEKPESSEEPKATEDTEATEEAKTTEEAKATEEPTLDTPKEDESTSPGKRKSRKARKKAEEAEKPEEILELDAAPDAKKTAEKTAEKTTAEKTAEKTTEKETPKTEL